MIGVLIDYSYTKYFFLLDIHTGNLMDRMIIVMGIWWARAYFQSCKTGESGLQEEFPFSYPTFITQLEIHEGNLINRMIIVIQNIFSA